MDVENDHPYALRGVSRADVTYREVAVSESEILKLGRVLARSRVEGAKDLRRLIAHWHANGATEEELSEPLRLSETTAESS